MRPTVNQPRRLNLLSCRQWLACAAEITGSCVLLRLDRVEVACGIAVVLPSGGQGIRSRDPFCLTTTPDVVPVRATRSEPRQARLNTGLTTGM